MEEMVNTRINSKDSDKFGINIEKYIKDYEKKLAWIQQERFAHLIVTVMTVFIEIFVIYIALFHPEADPYSAMLLLGRLVLLAFYFRHYFVLENTVQHWYMIAIELHERTLGA